MNANSDEFVEINKHKFSYERVSTPSSDQHVRIRGDLIFRTPGVCLFRVHHGQQ